MKMPHDDLIRTLNVKWSKVPLSIVKILGVKGVTVVGVVVEGGAVVIGSLFSSVFVQRSRVKNVSAPHPHMTSKTRNQDPAFIPNNVKFMMESFDFLELSTFLLPLFRTSSQVSFKTTKFSLGQVIV